MMPNDHTMARRAFLNRVGQASLAGIVGTFGGRQRTQAGTSGDRLHLSSSKLRIGTNLAPSVRWSPWWPDENAALRISDWFTDDWRGVETDERGYPLTTPVQTLIFHDIDSPAPGADSYPTGDYIITWEGTAALDVKFDARTISREPNRLVARVDRATESGFLLRAASGDLRNLQIAMPAGCPKPREILSDYEVVRFMDWLGVNLERSEPLTWENRPQPGSLRRFEGASAEYAIEDCVKLANDVGAEPWFCIHHTADETYIRGFAEYVAEHAQSQKVYVEWSNECWNVGFPQGRHYVFGGFGDWPEEIARDAARAFRIWREVLGDRVVRVAACQLHNPWVAQVLSQTLQGEFDVLAPAAYFGLPNPEEDGIPIPRTAAAMLTACIDSLRGGEVPELHQIHATLARRWGKGIVAYEGGQHLMQPAILEDPRLVAQMFRAQSLPEMKTAYLENLQLVEAMGYELFCHFTFGSLWDKYGCWGITSHQDVGSPKQDALREFLGRA